MRPYLKWILIVGFVLMAYSASVVRAQRGYQARLWGQRKDGKISQQRYYQLLSEDNYFKHAFNLKEILNSLD